MADLSKSDRSFSLKDCLGLGTLGDCWESHPGLAKVRDPCPSQPLFLSSLVFPSCRHPLLPQGADELSDPGKVTLAFSFFS